MWSTLLSAILVINELMASNTGEVMSPATNFDSWIEVYNPGDEAVTLDGMFLSNDVANPRCWKMPQGVGTVPAKGFLVVWLGSNNIKSNQAPFKLDCDGGTILISDATGQLVVAQDYPAAMSRTAWARQTDGTGEFGWTAMPTPGESNATSKFASQRLDPPVVSQGSKLFTGSVSFKVDIPEGATLMYTTDGSLPSAPAEEAPAGEQSPWKEWVKNGDCEGPDAECLISRDGDGTGDVNRIIDGVGYKGTRGIKVHAVANAAEDWTTQFFVYTPDHCWNAGDRYRFHMRVKADKACSISVQSHKTPGNYIHYSMLDGNYNIGTDWQEITYEGTITNEQAGTGGGGGWGWGDWGWGEPAQSEMQTIAFNLNQKKDTDNNFYFDDISWEAFTGDGDMAIQEVSKKSDDGRFTATQTTNYTFRLFRDGYLPSVPVVRSFIKTDHHYTIPVVSIVGNKKYFTDARWGIDTDGTNGRTGNGQSQPRNYNMDWERPVNFSYLTPQGEMLFNQDAEISVSGGWTRSAAPRSFKLKSGKEFDGQNRFDYPFFADKPYIRNKVLLLRNGGNDIWEYNTRFTDPALQAIIQRSGIDLDVQCYQPIIEYVNGEFRGVLNMREPNNKKFVEANYGYDDSEIDMFEMSSDSNLVFMQGTPDVLNRIYELGAHINDVGAYDELRRLLDVDEFINYMAMELFVGSTDWPHNNIKGFRSRHDGRYRFVTFDLDFAFKTNEPFKEFVRNQTWTFHLIYDTGEERTEEIKLVTFFLDMMKHEDFRRRFIDTYSMMAGSVFEKNRSYGIVDELAERVRPMTQLDGHQPDRAVSNIKNALQDRMNKMMNCLQQFDQAQLRGVKKLSVQLKNDTEGACIMANGLEVPYADFQGYLFAPATVEAIAPPGYRFVGWKSGAGRLFATDPVYNIPETGVTNITASFEPLSDDERAAQGFAPVRINEVSAANGIFVNEYWKRNDWIELYNTTSEPIDVDGMYLSDDPANPQKSQISKINSQINTVIPAHGYLVVWCDKLDPMSQLHASFKLAAEGGDVVLTAADGSWTDRFTYSEMDANQTAVRFPDGSDNVYTMNVPTIERKNLLSSYAVAVEQTAADGIRELSTANSQQLTIRYVAGRLVIDGRGDGLRLSVANLAGQELYGTGLSSAQTATVSLPHLTNGVYVATVTDRNGATATCKFVKR